MKARFLAITALILSMVSCQKDQAGLDVIVDGEQETTISVSLPEATRANSALGAFENLVSSSEYTIRYIFQVFYEGTELQAARQVIYTDENSLSFPVRLVPGRHYNFVVWADVTTTAGKTLNTIHNLTIADAAAADIHYNTENLKNITLKGEWNAMDETRDAFTGHFDTAVDGDKTTYNGAKSINIDLTRPFAKLRVITTDMEQLNDLGIAPTKATVEYTTDLYSSFNAFAGAVNTDTMTKTHSDFDIKVYGDNVDDKSKVLFTDYFFANNDVVKFNLTVVDQNGAVIDDTIAFNTDINVKRNHLTTIQGNILTDGSNIKVEVENDGKFEGEIVAVSNATDLQKAINDADENTTITLGGDINLGDLFGASTFSTRAAATLPIVIADDKVVVLDLNGHNITTPWEDEAAEKHYYAFENYGSLTIQDSKGNGQIIARGIFNYGTMTLESGKINACDHNGGYGVRNYEGSFTMNGGTIVASNENGDDRVAGNYDASPLRVDEGATATINGGNITNTSNYTVAIDNYGTTTINGGNITSVHSTVSNSGTMTIKGDATTIKCEGEYTSAHPIYAHGEASVTTIENGNIIGNDKASCYYVAVENNPKVYIYGGEFTNAGQAAFTGEGTIVVTGGQFDKDPSERVVEGYKVIENETGTYNVVEGDPVAQIGEKTYTTLKAAFEAVNNGETIKILNDITIQSTAVLAEGKTVTLNLNKKVITHKNKETGYALNNKGTLTINGNGTVNARGIYNGYGEGGENITTAKLTITNGTFNAMGTNGGAAIFNYGEVEVKGGKMESNGGYGLNNQSSGILKITGGEIRGGIYNLGTLTIDGDKTSVYQHLSGKHAIYCYASTTTINGGTFDSESGNELILADGTNCSVTINGGTFNKTAKSWLMGATTGKDITFNIYGGTFNGYVNMPEQSVDTFRPYNDPIVVYGGIYNFDPTKWLADGYIAKQKADNIYVAIENKTVAKVGNTEYVFIDEAIAAWTNGTTLTLMSDVTLNDVIKLKSTEHHTLNLGTYTLTAAKSKDAIEITCNGRSSASYALTINADATNPGGITATGKSCIYYKKSDSTKDRPIILINNGVFTGSYSINSISNGNTNCPQIWINGGIFNSYMNLTKNMLKVSGGTFHGAINCTGDTSAYREINGGRFKSWQFMTADAPSKFWVGSGNGNYNVGVYVDDEGYLVVGGPVITEFGDKFEAKANNYSKWSSYLKYSSAAEHGLYYTNADMAIAKHGEDNVELK
ncbi:MAG: hypothetical protein J6R38_02220 [Alistipes sp.]|nr:hypothetical protein [Alistipes sp.]